MEPKRSIPTYTSKGGEERETCCIQLTALGIGTMMHDFDETFKTRSMGVLAKLD